MALTALDGMFATADIPPNHTLYVRSINEKVPKGQLKRSLYAVFSPFGRVVDIVAQRTAVTRGQAWVVFESVAAATQAMRELQGVSLHDRPMRLSFAKGKSHATIKKEGGPVPKAKGTGTGAANGSLAAAAAGGAGASSSSSASASTATAGSKRRRGEMEGEEEGAGASASSSAASEPAGKRGAHEGEAGQPTPSAAAASASASEPNKMLLATGIPPEVNAVMLRALFGQFAGLVDLRVVPERGVAFVEYSDASAAIPAVQALHNFRLTATHALQVTFART